MGSKGSWSRKRLGVEIVSNELVDIEGRCMLKMSKSKTRPCRKIELIERSN